MRSNLIFALLMSPLFVAAQKNGVDFVQGLSWQEILQKAKTENRFVFLDCYASWCGPCKIMDKKVYSDDSVGAYMNARFICVKIQMDTSKNDDDEIKSLYATAHTFAEKYHIGAYPSYLFFSSDGQVVHKSLGAKSKEEFIGMANAATNPDQQYYTLLNNYRNGKIKRAQILLLVETAAGIGQDSLALKIAKNYIHKYLEMPSDEPIWTKENILFLHYYSDAVSSEDKIFHSYYLDRKTIDSVMATPGYSDNLLNYVLYRDKVKPQIDKALEMGIEPNWHRLEKGISKTYHRALAEKNLLKGRVEYYKSRKEWKNYINCFVLMQERDGVDTVKLVGINGAILNNDAYEVFQYSTNKRDLKKALFWVERALSVNSAPDPEEMDTKANLLYKLGRKTEGLAIEEKSHELLPRNREITACLKKMQNGQPTWSLE